MNIDGHAVAEWHHATVTDAADRAAYSIPEWAKRNGISVSMYHKISEARARSAHHARGLAHLNFP